MIKQYKKIAIINTSTPLNNGMLSLPLNINFEPQLVFVKCTYNEKNSSLIAMSGEGRSGAGNLYVTVDSFSKEYIHLSVICNSRNEKVTKIIAIG